MNKLHAVITAIGGYTPKYRLTNAEISTMVDTSDEWITKRIGIKERYILKPEEGQGVSYLALKAIEDLKTKHPFNPLDVEVVIFSTSTPDYLFPNTATLVAAKTGMTNAFGFDLEAACSGFLYALEVAQGFIVSGKYKKVMVIAGDVLSTIVDYKDRNTCPIFADACGCAIVEATTEQIGIVDSIMHSDGATPEALHIYGGGSRNPSSYETLEKRMHYIWQDGRFVFKRAIDSMVKCCNELLNRNQLPKEDITWVVPHQANRRIIDSVTNYLGVSRERVMINIEKYGNTSAATIPICLWEWEPQLRKGDKLLLTAFGAGFTWGAIYLIWGYDSA